MTEGNGDLRRQSLTLFGLVVLAVSLVGFLRGTSHTDYDFETPLRTVAHPVATEGVPVARSYRELRKTPRGAGSGFDDELVAYFEALPARTDVVEVTDDKAASLALRSRRRAYDGAPPTIPHPVRQAAASECAACHENGIKIGSRQASAFPHKRFENCTQCHAMAAPDAPWRAADLPPDPRAVPNGFDGLEPPLQGPRWTGIAPPQIPHKTFLHERCDSCHGVTGRNAMRSTHPQRQNCEQCHAPQAALEWRPGGRE